MSQNKISYHSILDVFIVSLKIDSFVIYFFNFMKFCNMEPWKYLEENVKEAMKKASNY
jgi:hypothetical protein